MNRIVCAWCQTVNDASLKACIACGAPLDIRPPGQDAPATVVRPVVQLTHQDVQKAGETAEKVYNSALGAYALAWRTLGEAAAIAVAAFLLGLAGGGTRLPWLGVLAGLALGWTVGAVQKNFWLAILGAPAGVVLGALIGMLPWALGAGPAGMVLGAAVVGVLGALAGRRNVPRANLWEKLRPWIGALGGLLFAALGALAGSALSWLVDAIARFLQG